MPLCLRFQPVIAATGERIFVGTREISMCALFRVLVTGMFVYAPLFGVATCYLKTEEKPK